MGGGGGFAYDGAPTDNNIDSTTIQGTSVMIFFADCSPLLPPHRNLMECGERVK